MNHVRYDSYLGLSRLLSAQHPRAEGCLAASEHLFIVAHQSSELWAKQCLIDVRRATALLHAGPAGADEAAQRLDSALACLRMLTANLDALHALPHEDFRRIRPALGSASGMQSTQMSQLMAILGVPGSRSPLFDAFRDLLRRYPLTLDDVCEDIDAATAPCRVARCLLAVLRAMTSWQTGHLRLVAHFLGDLPGTGGTAGADYLDGRVRPAFPDLVDGLRRREPV
ncbi:tryptophan 2,3-dioxygenase family protein [Pseudonocardia saturnea]